MALNVLFRERKPDLILSGINHGYNGSAAVLYSAPWQLPVRCPQQCSVHCFSLNDHHPDADFEASLYYGRKILENVIQDHPIPIHTLT